MSAERPLAPSLRDLAMVIGPAAAQRLAEALGGVEKQYVPQIARTDHPLAAIIGAEGLRALVAEHGGQYIPIPKGCDVGGAKRRVVAALDRGLSPRRAALVAGCTGRHARKIKAALRPDPDQKSLFDDPA